MKEDRMKEDRMKKDTESLFRRREEAKQAIQRLYSRVVGGANTDFGTSVEAFASVEHALICLMRKENHRIGGIFATAVSTGCRSRRDCYFCGYTGVGWSSKWRRTVSSMRDEETHSRKHIAEAHAAVVVGVFFTWAKGPRSFRLLRRKLLAERQEQEARDALGV